MNKDIAVIIGTGGMGRAVARRIGSGRRLLLADYDKAGLEAVADQLKGEGHDVAVQAVDVADAESVRALAATAAGLGPVTRVVHTAGLSAVQAPVDAILRVDLLGVALVLDAFGAVVAPGGSAVVIASMAGHLFPPLPPEQDRALAGTPAAELLALPFVAAITDSGAAYSIAKRGNILRVKAAAGTWGERGARVNSLSPGIISTPMSAEELAGESGERMRGMLAVSPVPRAGTPDDIADGACFLLGEGAAFVTGTDLLVDGGVVARLSGVVPGA